MPSDKSLTSIKRDCALSNPIDKYRSCHSCELFALSVRSCTGALKNIETLIITNDRRHPFLMNTFLTRFDYLQQAFENCTISQGPKN